MSQPQSAQATEDALPVPGAKGPVTLETLATNLQTCIAKTEIAGKHAERAADAAEDMRRLVGEIRTAVQRQASDYVSLRHGIPATWPGRLGLVTAAAVVGAVSAIVVVACGHPVPIPH